MTRDKQKDDAYFSKWIQFIVGSLERRAEEMPSLPYIPGRLGAAQSLASDALQLVIYQYSRGDSFDEIRPSVWRWIELKELQARVYATTPAEFQKVRAMYERVTLDNVYDALTMMAFSKAQRRPDERPYSRQGTTAHAG
ncbi:DUF1910 domain-containing protein (plasmid) [Rhizobium sp. NIBRBAC000502774]|nr:DUF1910 domain-containing protein [Rhizobium sp. NIBRBAC000502774]